MATRMACRSATKVIAISESGKRDLIHYFGVPADKISVIYPGVRTQFTRPPDNEIEEFRAQKNLPKQFILHVGTLQPRKNLSMLVKAFSQAQLQDVDLVFAGGKGWFYDKLFEDVQSYGLADKVHFPGYVPDEDLHLWYAAADLLVFPSVYEGFGMPIVEAMRCGTPVIASNASAMPEAVGEAGLLFDPNSDVELAKCMVSVMEDSDLRARMRRSGYGQAEKFSWKKAGRETSQVYLEILNRSDG